MFLDDQIVDYAAVPEPESPELYGLGSAVTFEALLEEYKALLETGAAPIICVSAETYSYIMERIYGNMLNRFDMVLNAGGTDYRGLKFLNGIIVVC